MFLRAGGSAMRNGWAVPCFLAVLLTASSPVPADLHRCVHVYDGDTIRIETGDRVRLIGVDAPEVHHPERGEEPFGREAMALTRELALGKRIELSYYTGNRLRQATRDRYDRVLAYVNVTAADGEEGRGVICLNRELLVHGLAAATRAWDHPRFDAYIRLEAAAREAAAGMWARSAGAVFVTPRGRRYHYPDCAMVKGRLLRIMTRERARDLGYKPCRVCRP